MIYVNLPGRASPWGESDILKLSFTSAASLVCSGYGRVVSAQALGSDCSAQGSQGWCLITDVLGGGAGGVS